MKTNLWIFAALIAACALLAAGQQAPAQEGAQEQAMLGDLNRDGACNILDVQAMICQALQLRERTREADVDENGSVDIYDVQQAVNTALETGGLVQRVRGALECEGDMLQDRLRVQAVAQDGQCAQADVDPETGEFVLRLRVKNAWSFAFFRNNGEEGQQQVGTLEIPVEDKASCVLPLAELAHGQELDLGHLQFQARMVAGEDLRNMFAHMNRWRVNADANADGIPDFCEPLLERAQQGPGVPETMRQGDGLAVHVAPCIAEWLDQISEPSLTDENEDGIPDFVEPLIACIEASIDEWFADRGQPLPPGGGDRGGTFAENLVAYVVEGVPDWIANLDNPDLIDVDGDGVPDYLEPLLKEPGGPNALDADGNGMPDFAQDHDGDGIPNCQDEDFQRPEDCDGDGIPNQEDRDCDNDGAPNYADAEPCNPDVQ